ncbi:Phosphoglycolate phosphatase [uncultured archaeon]|nr:Phosphoglycolate phosphatase [uncultured archaeon]
MKSKNRNFSRIIFDMDGVLYRGHTPIPGAAQALDKIRQAGYPISFVTNNATRSRAELQRRMKKMGIRAHPDEIMTSAYAAGCYLKGMKQKPKSVYVIGERGLKNELRSAGFSVLPLHLRGERESTTTFSRLSNSELHPASHVLVSGLDRHLTYAKLAAGLDMLNAGASWVACNLDPTLPMENGVHPGSGSLGACLAYAAGQVRPDEPGRRGRPGARKAGAHFSNIILREPDVVVGKPTTYMLDMICKKCSPAQRRSILFVGDRLDMDIAFASAGGLSSLLVLSGVAKKEEAKRAKGSLKPGAILNSVAELPKWLGV